MKKIILLGQTDTSFSALHLVLQILWNTKTIHQSLSGKIQRTSGFIQNADNARVVGARVDGSFEQTDASRLNSGTTVQAGEHVLVLPKVDDKNRQFALDITQILSQIAITAKVVFGL